MIIEKKKKIATPAAWNSRVRAENLEDAKVCYNLRKKPLNQRGDMLSF